MPRVSIGSWEDGPEDHRNLQRVYQQVNVYFGA